jgi:AmmeMemoRadiSam system protein B
MDATRSSSIAGSWYEANPTALAASIDSYLNKAQLPELNGQVMAVIAPHAGHQYSGHVAGYAFAALRGLSPDLIIILSPYHNYSSHHLLVTAHEAYATPLGDVEVDQSALAELRSELELPITTIANDNEHSIEIELPFLQRALKNKFKILPIMVRAQAPRISKILGDALANILKNKNALMVASTDLSHFHDQKTANNLDHEMLKRFESFDPGSIFEAEYTEKGFACGHAAVASMLWAAKTLNADKVQILKYATSGDITGDHKSVVGYGAAVVISESKVS